MPDINFKVEGLADLEKQLLDLGAQMGFKTLRTAGRKAMAPVLSAAQQGVNEDTGALKESLSIGARKGKGNTAVTINVGPQRSKARKSAAEAGVTLTGRENAKAGAQEYGTSRQKAEPFLRPALEKNAGKVLEEFKSQLVIAIDKAVKKQAST